VQVKWGKSFAAQCRSKLEFNVPFQHKYGYIRDKTQCMKNSGLVYLLLRVVISV